MKRLLLLFAICSAVMANGQNDTEITAMPDADEDDVRGEVIRGYPNDFFVWPVLKQRRQDFDFRSLDDSRRRLSYRSNKPYSFGVGAYLFELAVEIAFAIPLDERNQRIFGESKARDLQLNVIGRRWGFDVFHQRYKGFYIADEENPPAANVPYPQRPDVATRNIGATVSYLFNSKKFSLRSPYNFSERQLKSSGSFLLFGSLRYFRLSGDSALVGDSYQETMGPLSVIEDVNVTSMGAAPGYTYNLVYNGFFLNGTLGVGPGFNWVTYTLDNGGTDKSSRFSSIVAARVAIGYNGDRIFGGLSFTSLGGNARISGIEMNTSNSTFRILMGMRFTEKGILKKRVWDIPKALLN